MIFCFSPYSSASGPLDARQYSVSWAAVAASWMSALSTAVAYKLMSLSEWTQSVLLLQEGDYILRPARTDAERIGGAMVFIAYPHFSNCHSVHCCLFLQPTARRNGDAKRGGSLARYHCARSKDVQNMSASLEQHAASLSPTVKALIVVIVVLVALIVVGSIAAAWVLRMTQHRFDARKASPCTPGQLLAAVSSAEDHAALRDLLRRLDVVLAEAGVRYWIIGGTLLGAVRDGGVIPWDDDADVGVLASEWRAARSRLDALAQQQGIRIEPAWIGPSEKVRFVLDDNGLTESRKRVFVDIFEFNDATATGASTENILRPTSTYALVAFPTEWWRPDEVFPLRRYRLRQLHGAADDAENVDAVDVWGPAAYERYLDAKYPKWQSRVVVSRHDDATLLAPCAVHPDDVRRLMETLRAGSPADTT